MSASVTISNLTKRFGETHALAGVSLEVNRGELFGLIGPDGAGKTTLLRIMVTLLVPDSGTAQVLGHDVVSRQEFWELLGTLTAQGLTTIVSTPYMDEASRCGRIALVQQGRLLAVDRPSAIVAAFDRPLFGISAPKRYDALRALRDY